MYRLASAINKNSYHNVKKYLENGDKLSIEELSDAFLQKGQFGVIIDNTIELRIVDLLQEYQALPPDVSAATIKFIIRLLGLYSIQDIDLKDPDLNLNGCSGLPKPIDICISDHRYDRIKILIEAGVQERPLYDVFSGNQDSYLYLFNIIDCLKSTIERITSNILHKLISCEYWIEEKCKIAELLIKNPTENLYAEIEEKSKSEPAYCKFRFLPFFAWAAKNNRADLLNNACFVKLFVTYPEVALESIIFAAAIGAKDYFKAAMLVKEIDAVAIARALMSMASAPGNHKLFDFLVDVWQEIGFTLKAIFGQPSLTNESFFNRYEPLYWAVRSSNIEATAYFLQHGAHPDGRIDLEGSVLHLAIRMGNAKMVKMLLEYGADLECKKASQRTPLLEALAYKQKDIALMLVQEHNPDLHAKDGDNKTPLDYAQDDEIKEAILCRLSQQNDSHKNEIPSPLTLGFLSSNIMNKSPKQDQQQPLEAAKNARFIKLMIG